MVRKAQRSTVSPDLEAVGLPSPSPLPVSVAPGGSRDFQGGSIGRGPFDGGEEPVMAQAGLETGVRLPVFGDGLGDLLVEGREVGRRARDPFECGQEVPGHDGQDFGSL
ncbi:hypothetical protein [Microbispora sp. NPDC049633]|uniref:hypothetical protein n=1 Tax=Microbispora sp. NPDC049633 TaxID=3154355 RepID=UPI003431C29A